MQTLTGAAADIRAYLDEVGETTVPFHNLLTSWQLDNDPDSAARQEIIADLASVGVCVDRPSSTSSPTTRSGSVSGPRRSPGTPPCSPRRSPWRHRP